MSQNKRELKKKPVLQKPKPKEDPNYNLCPDCGWPVSICGCAK